jgi:hypothetical protein
MEQSAREADKSSSSPGIPHTLYNPTINWKNQLLISVRRLSKPVLSLTAYFINSNLVLSFHLRQSLPSSHFLHLSLSQRHMYISPHHTCHQPNHFIRPDLVAALSDSLLSRIGASSGRGRRM